MTFNLHLRTWGDGEAQPPTRKCEEPALVIFPLNRVPQSFDISTPVCFLRPTGIYILTYPEVGIPESDPRVGGMWNSFGMIPAPP
jgi:hypothetical protein